MSPKNNTSVIKASGLAKVEEEVRIIKPGGKVEEKNDA